MCSFIQCFHNHIMTNKNISNGTFVIEGTSIQSVRSGIGRYVFELVSSFDKIGVDMLIIQNKVEKDNSEFDRWSDKQFFLSAFFRKLIWVLSDKLPFFKINWLIRGKSNIFIFPNFKYLRTKSPSLTIVHDISYTKDENWISKGLRKRLNLWVKLAIKSNSAIATVSNAAAAEIAKYYSYPLEKILILPPGLNPQMANTKPDAPLGSRKGYLVVGTLERRKNQEQIIMSFCNLSETSQKNNPLTIVGGISNNYENLLGLAKGNKYITIRTTVSNEELIELYQRNRYLISASSYEGFGMQVAEAMHFNMGLILSDILVHYETSGGNAIFFPVGDVNTLSSLLENIDENLIIKNIASANRFSEIYNFDTTAKKVIDFFKV